MRDQYEFDDMLDDPKLRGCFALGQISGAHPLIRTSAGCEAAQQFVIIKLILIKGATSNHSSCGMGRSLTASNGTVFCQ